MKPLKMFVLAFGTMTLASFVSAQALPALESKDFAVERLRPTTAKEGIIDAESGKPAPHLSTDVGLWLGYSKAPLVLRDIQNDTTIPLVDHRVGAHLTLNLGLWDWAQLGLDIPMVAFQSRPDLALSIAQGGIQSFGLGDMRVVPKVALLKSQWAFVDASILAGVTLPSARLFNSVVNDTQSLEYLGNDGVSVSPALALSKDFWWLRSALNVGYRWRQKTGGFGDLNVGNEVFYRLAAAVSFKEVGVPVEAALGFSGQSAASADFWKAPGDNLNQQPLETLLQVQGDLGAVQLFVGGGVSLIRGYGTPSYRAFGGVRYAPRGKAGDLDRDGIDDARDRCPSVAEDRDGFEDKDGCPENDNDQDGVSDLDDACPLQAGPQSRDGCPEGLGASGSSDDGDGDGISDSVDKCPKDAEDIDGFDDDDGCPDIDNDGDGVLDSNDKCPSKREDRDGVMDTDGCPEVDGDNDGIIDAQDECPEEAEVINGNKDGDGCPDEGASKVRISEGLIEILEAVEFKSGTSRIQRKSYGVLNQVVSVLKNHPEIESVRIEGHTDSKGKVSYNKRLSLSRAKAVRRFLIKRGIEKSRLLAQGFGPERPIADNATKEGRAKNRRVMFVIE